MEQVKRAVGNCPGNPLLAILLFYVFGAARGQKVTSLKEKIQQVKGILCSQSKTLLTGDRHHHIS